MTTVSKLGPHGEVIRSTTTPLLPGDELTLWSCQVRGIMHGNAHSAIPGRYIIESCPSPCQVTLRKLDSGTLFHCGAGSLFAIIGEPWSNYTINSDVPLALKG